MLDDLPSVNRPVVLQRNGLNQVNGGHSALRRSIVMSCINEHFSVRVDRDRGLIGLFSWSLKRIFRFVVIFDKGLCILAILWFRLNHEVSCRLEGSRLPLAGLIHRLPK